MKFFFWIKYSIQIENFKRKVKGYAETAMKKKQLMHDLHQCLVFELHKTEI